jgi:FeS assembly protein IscX
MNWDSTYAIALELRRQHPDADIEQVSLKQIHDWTLALSEFEDDPALVNDDILYAIYQDWFEENLHGK